MLFASIWNSFLAQQCVKSVQIRSYFWSVFSLNAGKYGPAITPYLDTFHVVQASVSLICQYAATLSMKRGLIYFCKAGYSRIFINFSRNWLGLNNLCEISRINFYVTTEYNNPRSTPNIFKEIPCNIQICNAFNVIFNQGNVTYFFKIKQNPRKKSR